MKWLTLPALLLALLLAGCASGDPTAAPGPGHATATPPAAWSSPAPLSARLVLPAQVMTAGSSMRVHVLVDNRTGHAVHTLGCLSLFEVDLTRPGYQPTVAWADCLQRFTIPVGQTRYRLTLRATFNQCGRGPQTNGGQTCLSGGGMPPLPAGTYHARLFQSRQLVGIPAPVTVRVTRASH